MDMVCEALHNEIGLWEIDNDELFALMGGVNWEATANLALSVAVVSSAIPGGQAVTIVCGCYAAGYYLGQAIKG